MSEPSRRAVGPRVTVIVARARNGVIGRANDMPWRIPEEMRHFRTATMGHALIVGRRTFESIGRALPGRRMIVVSRTPGWQAPGCERAGSLTEAIALAAVPGPAGIATDEVFVAGGASLYAQAMPLADRLLVTEIDLTPEGDAHFQAPDPAEWRLAASEDRMAADGTRFSIQDWRRS